MAPKFPNPDPPTDSVRDRLDQFIQVAGRAVYPPLAVAPSPTTAGQVWWDISSTVKIRDEANADWASLATIMGAVSFKEAQTLTSGEKTRALTNIGAQPVGGYVQYDAAQTLTSPQRAQAAENIEAVSYGQAQTLTSGQREQARDNIGVGSLGVLDMNEEPADILMGDGAWQNFNALLVAQTPYNSIGSVVFAAQSGSFRGPGDTVAGSILRPAGVSGTDGGGVSFRLLNAFSMTGTWMALGYSFGVSGGAEGATLWRRIS